MTLCHYTHIVAKMKALLKKIEKLEGERERITSEMLETTQMVRGTFANNYRRCGKATCWCYESEKGHPCNRITWTKNAKTGSKVIPEKDVSWIKEMTANYKGFKKNRQRLRKINEDLRLLLDKLEDAIIKKTHRRREYL